MDPPALSHAAETDAAPLLVCAQAAEMVDATVSRLARSHRMLMAARAMVVRARREAWDARTDLLVQRAIDLGVNYDAEQDRAINDLQRCMEERATALLWAAEGCSAERALRDEFVALATTVGPELRSALRDLRAALPMLVAYDAAELPSAAPQDAPACPPEQGAAPAELWRALQDPHVPTHVAHRAARAAGLSSWFVRTFAVSALPRLVPAADPTAAHPGWGDHTAWRTAPSLRARSEAWPALWHWLQLQRTLHEAGDTASEFGDCHPVALLVPNAPQSTARAGWGALDAAAREFVTELLGREGFWLRCELRAWLNAGGLDGGAFFPVGEEEEAAYEARGLPRSVAAALALPRGARFLLSARFYALFPTAAPPAEQPQLVPLPREALVFCTAEPISAEEATAGWDYRQKEELAGADMHTSAARARWTELFALSQTAPQ